MITISPVMNGAFVNYSDRTEFYKFDEADLSGLAEMFWSVAEACGPITGRYSKERIAVRIVHGDKYECRDKKCKICREEADG